MLLEYANSLACVVGLVSLMPVATLVGPTKHPVHAALLIALAIALYFQISAPWAEYPPTTVWHTSVLHVLLALSLLVPKWRHTMWLIVRVELGDEHEHAPVRRVSDIERMLEHLG